MTVLVSVSNTARLCSACQAVVLHQAMWCDLKEAALRLMKVRADDLIRFVPRLCASVAASMII